MTVNVITYHNPQLLNENIEFKHYLGTLHICATNSLRKGVKSRYQDKEESITAPIISAGLLFSKLLGYWSSSHQKIIQFTQLTRVIKKHEYKYGQGLIRAFRNNQLEVLTTMRALAEIGVSPNKLQAQTREESLFQNIWEAMEYHDNSFARIRKSLQEVNLFEKKLWEAVKEAQLATNKNSEYRKTDQKKEIVLHGFYFITPLQHRIFSLMKEAGYTLIFLNLYDPRYPKTFSSVDTYLGEWLPKHLWKIEEPSKDTCTWGDLFSSSYESKKNLLFPDDKKPEILAFENFNSFLQDFSDNNKQVCLSPKHKEFNERLKEYYPEGFSDKHFLSYPIGQYLLHLHSMWDENSNQLILTEKGLFECFSSGWLVIERENARNYTIVLRDILPYFTTCTTITEWLDQTKLLKSVRLNAVKAFEKSDNRFHQMMENPLLRFSFFKRSTNEINMTIAFIEKLIAQAEFIFSGDSISIGEHFEKLQEMLQGSKQEGAFYEVESQLVLDLQKKLDVADVSEEKYYVEDLSYAVSLYLGGGLKGDFDDEFDEIDGLTFNKIKSFENADEAPYLEEALEENLIIHLTGLDEDSLPYSSQVIPWPLTRSTLEKLKLPEIKMLFIREYSTPAIARYLFYNVLAFTTNIRLSWIRNFNGESFNESVYLMLLNLEEEVLKDTIINGEALKLSIIKSDEFNCDDTTKYPSDAAAEYAVCPRRYYYSFVVQKFSSYHDEFHHQFLVDHIIKAGLHMSGSSPSEVLEQVTNMFPQLSRVKLRQSFENAQGYKRQFEIKYDDYDGKSYVRGRELFQFLLKIYPSSDKNLLSDAMEILSKGNSKILEEINTQEENRMIATPSSLCRFCPHLKICDEGWYAVDDKMRSML